MSDQVNQTSAGASGVSGKKASLWSQIIAAIWIAGWSAYKFLANPQNVDVGDVGLSGVLIAACFTPVYFSIIMDKIKEIRGSKS